MCIDDDIVSAVYRSVLAVVEPIRLSFLVQLSAVGVTRTLLDRSRPIHEVVKVDIFVPGCPPHADVIFYAITELLAGRMPDVAKMGKFG